MKLFGNLFSGTAADFAADAARWDEAARTGLAQLYMHPAAPALFSRLSKGASVFAVDDAGVILITAANRPMPKTASTFAAIVAALSAPQLQAMLVMMLQEISRPQPGCDCPRCQPRRTN